LYQRFWIQKIIIKNRGAFSPEHTKKFTSESFHKKGPEEIIYNIK